MLFDGLRNLFGGKNKPKETIDLSTGNKGKEPVAGDELQKDYLKKVRSKNKNLLIELTQEEKERIADYLYNLYEEVKDKQSEIEDRIDEEQEVMLMQPKVLADDEDTPSYQSPLTFVTVEVIHANRG